jgi:hypothetical protein
MAVTEFDAAAPFIVGVLLVVVGAGGSKLVEVRVSDAYQKQIAEAALEKEVPGFLRPPALAELAGWAIDAAQALAIVVAPATGLALLSENLDTLAIVAYVGAIVIGFLVSVFVIRARPDRYARRTWRGWISPVFVLGVVVNVAAGILAAASVG